jgi:hypothetical protein
MCSLRAASPVARSGMSPGAPVRVVIAAGHLESRAQRVGRVGIGHGGYPFVALTAGSDRMAKVF